MKSQFSLLTKQFVVVVVVVVCMWFFVFVFSFFYIYFFFMAVSLKSKTHFVPGSVCTEPVAHLRFNDVVGNAKWRRLLSIEEKENSAAEFNLKLEG